MNLADARYRIHGWLQGEGRGGKLVQTVIVTTIFASVVGFVLGTDRTFHAHHEERLLQLETATIMVFTMEYVLRLWTAGSTSQGGFWRRSIGSRVRYLLSFFGLIDLVAILPFYLGAHVGTEFLRVLRFVLILRILKIARYSSALHVLAGAFRRRRDELLSFLGIVLLMLFLSGSVIWIFEHEAQPEKFGSIPRTLWWAIVTMTTVGYGDVYPVTIAGKIFAGFVMLTGIGVIAVPTGLIGAALNEEFNATRTTRSGACPTCGAPTRKQEVA